MRRSLPFFIAVTLGLLCVPNPAHADFRFGVRGGLSSNPDQLVLGGSAWFYGLAPRLVIDGNLLLGVGDNVTSVRINGDFKYLIPAGAVLLYPTLGPSLQFFRADCPTGFDCSGSEVGINFGGGVALQRFAFDLQLGLGDISEITMTATYFFR